MLAFVSLGRIFLVIKVDEAARIGYPFWASQVRVRCDLGSTGAQTVSTLATCAAKGFTGRFVKQLADIVQRNDRGARSPVPAQRRLP